jgi:hypothetical protein
LGNNIAFDEKQTQVPVTPKLAKIDIQKTRFWSDFCGPMFHNNKKTLQSYKKILIFAKKIVSL